ncbi:hypothetical protein GCM10027578_03690 [Spirosoma luteolum]
MGANTGKYMMLAGGLLLGLGSLIWLFADKLHWLGRLPGDIRIPGRDGGGFYAPLMTCLVVSLVLNLVIALIRRFFGS